MIILGWILVALMTGALSDFSNKLPFYQERLTVLSQEAEVEELLTIKLCVEFVLAYLNEWIDTDCTPILENWAKSICYDYMQSP